MHDWYLQNGSHDREGKPIGAIQIVSPTQQSDITQMDPETKAKTIGAAIDYLASLG